MRLRLLKDVEQVILIEARLVQLRRAQVNFHTLVELKVSRVHHRPRLSGEKMPLISFFGRPTTPRMALRYLRARRSHFQMLYQIRLESGPTRASWRFA